MLASPSPWGLRRERTGQELRGSGLCLSSHYSLDKRGGVDDKGTGVIRGPSNRNKISAAPSQPSYAAGLG